MPRYFFDITMADRATLDPMGVVCCDDEFACQLAWASLAGLTNELKKQSWQQCELSVRREDGLHIGCLSITVEFAGLNPATRAILTSRDELKPLPE